VVTPAVGATRGRAAAARGRLTIAANRLAMRSLRRASAIRGPIDFGSLRRTTPVSGRFGFDRGRPVDRFYIERFLAANADRVRGEVLEFGDDAYTRLHGGGEVTGGDVIDIDPRNPHATIVGDIGDPATLPHARYDCIICTQVIHLVADMPAAVRNMAEALRPGGTLLLTVPGITQIDRKDTTHWYWSLTRHGAGVVTERAFPWADVEVEGHGNVLSAIAFLHGLSATELEPAELAARDPRYDLVVTVRATAGGG
jgi:SAM-dependent methyltransferase